MHELQTSAAKDGAAKSSVSTGRSDSKHVQYVRDLSAAVAVLQSKMRTLHDVDKKIKAALSEIRTCSYDIKSFETQLDAIQNGVDKLNLENYVNLPAWVGDLNSELRSILEERLNAALGHWTRTFSEATSVEGPSTQHLHDQAYQ
ncbi:MAG: hypothetical protein M1823_007822, partial [Watsoniomyces obsoletus]